MKCEEHCTTSFPFFFFNFSFYLCILGMSWKKILQFISVLPGCYGFCRVSCDVTRKTLSPVGNNCSSEEKADAAGTSLSHPTMQQYWLKKQYMSEICLYCLAVWCLISILNYAGEHKVPLLHPRKYKIFFFFLEKDLKKSLLHLLYVFPLTSDPRYTNLTTNIIYI